MIRVNNRGNFSKTEHFIHKMLRGDIFGDLGRYGELGVAALSRATPVDTGLASESWYYKIKKNRKGFTLSWHNDDVENGQVVVILVQYGHATRSGAYVSGHDFVNPTIRPVFEAISNDIWKKVTSP